MKPNKTLEQIKTFAKMMSTFHDNRDAGEDYYNMKVDKIWLEGRLEKYKRAFKALNSLNPDLELRIVDSQSYLLEPWVSYFGKKRFFDWVKK